MIDFSKITKTLDGYDCLYFGTRDYNGTTLHCFGVMHPHFGVKEAVYNAEGRRLTLAGGQWFAVLDADCQIVKPKKKVSVTRWVVLYSGNTIGDGHFVCCYEKEPQIQADTLSVQQHTFTFEVDE